MSSQGRWSEVLPSETPDRGGRSGAIEMTPLVAWTRQIDEPDLLILMSPDLSDGLPLRLTLTGPSRSISSYVGEASAGFLVERADDESPPSSPVPDIVSRLRSILDTEGGETWRDALNRRPPTTLDEILGGAGDSATLAALDLLLDASPIAGIEAAPSPDALEVSIDVPVESTSDRFALLSVMIDPTVRFQRSYKQTVWGPATFTVTRKNGSVRIWVSPGIGFKDPNNTSSVITTNGADMTVYAYVSNRRNGRSSEYTYSSRSWIPV